MKRLLFLNFHPAFAPPRSGGELRYWNLATRLAQTCSVRMINPTFGEAAREEVAHAPQCVELRLPKPRAYNAWHHFLDRWAGFRECSALVATLACRRHRAFIEEARAAARDADVLVLASPFMWPAAPRPRGGQLLVYDAYNVEARLAREALGGGLWGRWGTRRIARIERDLARRADLVLACSREDAEEMADLHGIEDCRIVVVPNGVDTTTVRPATTDERHAARARLNLSPERPALLFLGSFHPPNIEAVEFLIADVAPTVEGVDILIAGKVCDAVRGQTPANVRLLGLVDDATRAGLLAACDVALNPMFSGSGTNLKMLEFLAAGLPVVTTPTGARGLEVRDGEQARIADRAHFARAVAETIADPTRAARHADAGRQHAVARFDWAGIVERLRSLLEHKLSPRVLMLNDYPVTPVMSGGQVRLEAVARRVAQGVGPVTIVTLTKAPRGRHEWLGPGIEELNIPRSWLHNAVDRLLGGWMTVAADDASALLFWRATPALACVLRREMRAARVVLLDHVYMTNAARALHDTVPLVYESHNVETDLKRVLYGRGLLGDFLVATTRRAERWALRHGAFVSCVADEDRRAFVERFGAEASRLVVAANGVECAARPAVAADDRMRLRTAIGMGPEPALLFVGSGHPPNRDAVEFILREIAPAHPDCTFLIAGNVCGWFHSHRLPDNVVCLGPIETTVKEYLLQCADVALNPLFGGSGSSLKVPEYLSAGLPVLSSDVGMRGFGTNGAREVVVLEREALAREVGRYARDLEWRRGATQAARARAEREFDWSVTLEPLVARLNELLQR